MAHEGNEARVASVSREIAPEQVPDAALTERVAHKARGRRLMMVTGLAVVGASLALLPVFLVSRGSGADTGEPAACRSHVSMTLAKPARAR